MRTPNNIYFRYNVQARTHNLIPACLRAGTLLTCLRPQSIDLQIYSLCCRVVPEQEMLSTVNVKDSWTEVGP